VPPALFALFVATFGIATTEFAVVGLLPEIASDFKIAIPTAGLLVSAYAFGVAIGGPVIVIATTRMARKPTLVLLMSIFVVGHAMSALAGSYELLFVSRLVAAVCHASFLGIAAVVAAASVPEGQGQTAVSRVWLGFSAASLIGVPAGTALGQALGWRATFWAIAAIGLVSLAMIARWVPSGTKAGSGSLANEFRTLRRRQVILAMALSLFVCAITFSVFTFIAPMLRDATGIEPANVPYMLLFFGLGGTAGLAFAGRFTAIGQLRMVLLLLIAQLVTFLVFAVFMGNPLIVAAVLVVWGFLFLAPCVPLQTRVVEQAIEAPNLASTLNQATFNVGNAIGPLLGASALSLGLSYVWLPIVGIALTAIAVAVAFVAIKSDRRVAIAATHKVRPTSHHVTPSEPTAQ
jgi:DHA1 family inner membrane transport protein